MTDYGSHSGVALSALDSLSMFERFVLYVLYARAGTPGGDGELWTEASVSVVSDVVGCPSSRVSQAFARLLGLGLVRAAAIGGVDHFILPATGEAR